MTQGPAAQHLIARPLAETGDHQREGIDRPKERRVHGPRIDRTGLAGQGYMGDERTGIRHEATGTQPPIEVSQQPEKGLRAVRGTTPENAGTCPVPHPVEQKRERVAADGIGGAFCACAPLRVQVAEEGKGDVQIVRMGLPPVVSGQRRKDGKEPGPLLFAGPEGKKEAVSHGGGRWSRERLRRKQRRETKNSSGPCREPRAQARSSSRRSSATRTD
jgi:hypothetical protein